MPTIDLSILNQRQTPAFYADVFANRPAAGFIGRIFVSTDTFAFYRDNGTGWDLIGGPGTGTITGSGASGQIALWSGASTIAGDTGLTYDGTDNSLTASKFIVTGGTSSQFLKGDGSLDSSAYITASALTSYVPYTGATANVNLGINDITAGSFTGGTGSFDTSGSGNTVGINHSSGSGIGLNINKSGSGEGLFITKGSGGGNAATINGGLVRIENNSGDAQLQIVSSSAPSVRIDNAATGATKRAGLGISTAVNNFIQGSADRDFCMFNSSTTASPILFGIYDAGLTNTQEAARISPARNFLIGTTTDNGQKLQVNGDINTSSSLSVGSLATQSNSQLQVLGNFFSGFYRDLTSGGRGYFIDIGAKTASNTLIAGAQILGSVAAGDADGSLGFYTRTSNSLTEKLTITSTGYVGINTNVPTSQLSIAVTSGDSILTMGGNGSSARSLRLVKNYDNFSSILYFSDHPSSGAGYFAINSDRTNEALRITSSRNLLIGTTTDAGQKLQVAGIAQATSFRSINGTKSIASGATETIYAIPASTSADGTYFVHVEVTTGSAIYMASGVVTAIGGNGEAFFTSFYDGSNVTLSVSGLNIQVTNGGFSTFTWSYSILFQSNN